MNEQLSHYLKHLQDHAKSPRFVDFQVLAERDRSAEKGYYLFLKLYEPKTREFLCNAFVYPMEWYPGRQKQPDFSHYQNVLRYCYAGLISDERPPELLLQVLQAVWIPATKEENERSASKGSGSLILLKYIIAPDFNITGAELEGVFNCPAKYFYESFLGLQRSIRNTPTSIGFVRGSAIHKGIQYASNEWVRSQDPEKAMRAYHRAVLDVWRDNFDILIRKSYTRGPSRDLKLPLQVDSIVVDNIIEQFKKISPPQLLNESLLFSPERGISGRADQIILRETFEELWEIKTGSRYYIESDYDPFTGIAHPGGVQAFAYHEIIKKITGRPPKTFIEFFDADAGLSEDNPEIIPLQEHAVIKRRKIDLDEENNEEYLNLLLQTRNIAFAIESGLLSGYDRYKINRFLSRRYMPALGTDFNLLSSNWSRVCGYCPSNQLGICADGKRLLDPDIWLHFPQSLFEYWAWYFKQLKFELNNVKWHLYRLATTNIEVLENQGVTISNLKKVKFDSYRYFLTLKASKRIFTRIREGDTVFVTPAHLTPGEIFSTEGKVHSLRSDEIVIKTRSIIKSRDQKVDTFRVDQVENVLFSKWQSRSLTDFLFGAMARSGILGRTIADSELPFTVQLLLGIQKPNPTKRLSRKGLLTVLDSSKVEAIEKALGLNPGEMLLVQGPPGTGKTRMIAQMAKEMFAEAYLLRSQEVDETAPLTKAVLILANTHRAADEVIVKLSAFQDLKPFIIRLESYSKEHPPEVQEFIIPNQVAFDETMGERANASQLVAVLQKGNQLFNKAGIVVGTLGSVGSNLLKGLNFKWIIVDEAGQATEPACLGAFRHLTSENASIDGYPRIILVGDHFQLPPVVAEETANYAPSIPPQLQKAGLVQGDSLKTSLFERLFRLWNKKFENVVILNEQYRMNEAICRIIRKAFYPEVDYKPANESIASHTLMDFLAAFGESDQPKKQSKLIAKVFAPEQPVIFINTENDKEAFEGRQEVDIQTESRFNVREAKIASNLVAEFLAQFRPEVQLEISKQIGIISPYRYQNNLIYSEMRAIGLVEELIENIRVDTVDRFQGDEREIILISLTNSNDEHLIGQLHAEWRRLNVSISRAKAKLILLGNRQTFTEPSKEANEEQAKERFQIVFETIDKLKQEGLALEIPSQTIAVKG